MTMTPDQLGLDLQTARDAVHEEFEQQLSELTSNANGLQAQIRQIYNLTRQQARRDYMNGKVSEGTYRAELQLIEDQWAQRRADIINGLSDRLSELTRWHSHALNAIADAGAAGKAATHTGLPFTS